MQCRQTFYSSRLVDVAACDKRPGPLAPIVFAALFLGDLRKAHRYLRIAAFGVAQVGGAAEFQQALIRVGVDKPESRRQPAVPRGQRDLDLLR